MRRTTMVAEVLTFAGTHPFHRQHAGARGSRAEELIAQERCPRCEGPLYPPDRERYATLIRKGDPYPIWRPAGSRVTACRCIPVCDICGFAESVGLPARDLILDGMRFAYEEPGNQGAPRPVDPETKKACLEALEYVSWTASAVPGNWPVDRDRMILGVAVVQASGILTERMPDEVNLENVSFNPHPGGWADPDN